MFVKTRCANASSIVRQHFGALGLWGWAGSLYAYHGHDRIFARRVQELSAQATMLAENSLYPVRVRAVLLLHSMFGNKAERAFDVQVLRAAHTLLALLAKLEHLTKLHTALHCVLELKRWRPTQK